MQDEERRKFLHLKEQSIKAVLLIKGIKLWWANVSCKFKGYCLILGARQSKVVGLQIASNWGSKGLQPGWQADLVMTVSCAKARVQQFEEGTCTNKGDMFETLFRNKKIIDLCEPVIAG